MIGIFWNIRGLGTIGRIPALVNRLKVNHVDFVGILETNKEDFSPSLLKSLTGNTPFSWCHQPAKRSVGGILVGVNANLFVVTIGQILDFSVSVMLLDKKQALIGGL
jgi:hypothetical protein